MALLSGILCREGSCWSFCVFTVILVSAASPWLGTKSAATTHVSPVLWIKHHSYVSPPPDRASYELHLLISLKRLPKVIYSRVLELLGMLRQMFGWDKYALLLKRECLRAGGSIFTIGIHCPVNPRPQKVRARAGCAVCLGGVGLWIE